MGFKEWMQKRIEKDAVVSHLYGRKVVLKKSTLPIIGGEWKEIHPPLDENGKWNYINLIFGGWRNFVTLLVILGLVGLFLIQYIDAINIIKELQEVCICPSEIGKIPFK